MTEDDNIKILVEDDKHTLQFKYVSTDDAGLFTARAVNPAGQMACNGRLKVIRKILFSDFIFWKIFLYQVIQNLTCYLMNLSLEEKLNFINTKTKVYSKKW